MKALAVRVQEAFPQIYFACHVQHAAGGQRGDTLSDRDGRIVAHLHEDRGVSQGELARHLHLQGSTLSEALDKLESAGLVERRRLPNDRRRVEVWRTAAGTTAMSAGSVLDTERLEELLAALPEDERAAAVTGIELLARAARSLTKRYQAQHPGRPSVPLPDEGDDR